MRPIKVLFIVLDTIPGVFKTLRIRRIEARLVFGDGIVVTVEIFSLQTVIFVTEKPKTDIKRNYFWYYWTSFSGCSFVINDKIRLKTNFQEDPRRYRSRPLLVNDYGQAGLEEQILFSIGCKKLPHKPHRLLKFQGGLKTSSVKHGWWNSLKCLRWSGAQRAQRGYKNNVAQGSLGEQCLVRLIK